MQSKLNTTRRQFVSALAGSSLALAGARVYASANPNRVPVGLELYSVRHELEKEPSGTLQRVAQMGYDCVEFYAPYHDWTPEHAKEVREPVAACPAVPENFGLALEGARPASG